MVVSKAELWGGGGGNLRAILVQVNRPVFFNPTPIIYLVFEKNDLFIYFIEQNVYIFRYCSLIFMSFISLTTGTIV